MSNVTAKYLLLGVTTAVLAFACSSPTIESGTGTTLVDVPVTVEGCAITRTDETTSSMRQNLVEANQVIVEHGLTGDEQRLVDWALGRFHAGRLPLPHRIEFVFDPTGEQCRGHRGTCDPSNGTAQVVVCLPLPEAAHKRAVVLLHELAHLWDWAQGDGLGWPDRSEIVGGFPEEHDVESEDRSVERVAQGVTWGLYDGAVRPHAMGLSNIELCNQYESLTGTLPPAPVRSLCLAERSS